MKYSLLLFLFIYTTICQAAAPPEKIYSITRKDMPLDYYLEQGQLWKAETRKTPTNSEAWFNYYKAARYANHLSQGAEIKPFDKKAIVEQIQEAIPETFVQYYTTFAEAPWGEERWENLFKAYHTAPNRPETYQSLMTYYELEGDIKKVAEFSQKWYDSGTYSAGILHWNFNLLMSLEDNAIVLTNGDNDTYPIWLLQNVKGIRKDIRSININLLTNVPEYKELIFRELGIEDPFVAKTGSVDKSYEVSKFLFEKSKRPVYLAITSRNALREKFGDDLYLTGLAFKMSKKSFDNVAVLKNNFENRFLKDYLWINLQNDTSISVVNVIGQNYLPAFLTLHRHYVASGETQKAIELKDLTLQVAERAGRGAQMTAYFAESDMESRVIDTAINWKQLEKEVTPVQNGLYAGITEVSNEQYEAFLIDLVKNRQYDLLEKCKVNPTNWRALLPANFKELKDKEIFPNAHPDEAEAPVQNISYAAAKAYCEWITNVYNQSESSKKRFQKVKFRLPNIDEWTAAAQVVADVKVYPWEKSEMGAKPTNVKGCYVANFNVSELPCKDCPSPFKGTSNDGGFFTVKVDSYFPNDFKLYNTIGNVAEMVQEEGIAKGGSWEDTPENCTLSAVKNYDNASPAVGFRVFMEVIK